MPKTSTAFRPRYEEFISAGPGTNQGRRLEHRCVLCGKASPHQPRNRCDDPDCKGMIDVFYDLDSVSILPSRDPLRRYADLLPIVHPENLIWLGEGNTPCVRARRLGNSLGLDQLYLKDETRNPTMSTKDRIASVGLSYFRELDVREFVMASTGNSSTAYAHAVQLVGGDFHAHIFVGRRFAGRLNYPDSANVTTWVVERDFVSAGAAAKEFAAANGLFFEGGFFNPARREGLKLAYLEAYDQMPVAPNYVFQAVSSGMGLIGAYKGALEYRKLGRLDRLPRFIAVQQQSCDPMAHAFGEGAAEIGKHHIVPNPRGMAAAILRGDPTQSYPYVRHVALDSGGDILSVEDAEICRARRRLYQCEGIRACHASATALAAAIRLAEAGLISRCEPVLVNLTGSDRPKDPRPEQLIPYRIGELVRAEK